MQWLLAVSSGFNPNDHSSLVQALRNEIGPPTTKVHLPVPIQVNGKETSIVNTRALSNRFATHRQTINQLSEKGNYKGSSTASKVPLHLYGDAYDPTVGAFAKSMNGILDEDEALATATNESMTTLRQEDIDMAQAIKASIQMANNSSGTGTSASNPVVLLMTPPPTNFNVRPVMDGIAESTEANMMERVRKRAFRRSNDTIEVVDTDNPTSSPLLAVASPNASKMFHKIATKDPSITSYIDTYEAENPEADSQEVYGATSNYMDVLEGKPRKKRRNNKK